MLTQIKNAKFYLQAKLGLSQRGWSMLSFWLALLLLLQLSTLLALKIMLLVKIHWVAY